MKIYTKTGDSGTTGLIGGSRVEKNDDRLEAYGTMDELNSFLGLLASYKLDIQIVNTLTGIQNNLFNIGSYLATDFSVLKNQEVRIELSDNTKFIENEIDRMNEVLPELNNFILPGGNEISAVCHICRSVTRRAERCVYTVKHLYPTIEDLSIYINRLSDYFFVLARFINLTYQTKEINWKK